MNKQDLKKIIGTATCILDIGSYNGTDARELHDLFGCEVHCFEPNQEVFKHSEGLVYWPVAVGNKDERAMMYISKRHMQSSSINEPKDHLEIWPDIEFKDFLFVDMIKIDTWNWGNKMIDLIWADLNGNEGEFIKGAEKTLKNTRYLYLEVSDKCLYYGQPNSEIIIDMLYDFEEIAVYDENENYRNILFKNVKL